MNISFVHSKGGVTKSSLAANLTVFLRSQGHATAALDLDSGTFGNNSLTASLRRADPDCPVFSANSPAKLKGLFHELAPQFDFIVADAPGGFQRTAQVNLELLRYTDFALVPVKPEFDDIEPLHVVERVITEARRSNPVLDARVIINCLDMRTKWAREIDKTKVNIQRIAPALSVMQQTVRIDRQAFQTARINGNVVVQGKPSQARSDLVALFAELLAEIVISIRRFNAEQDNVLTTEEVSRVAAIA